MTQNLIDFDALARRSDPATSKVAAREVNLTQAQQRAWEAAKELGPSTANEIGTKAAEMFGGMAETYRKRARELARLGRFEIEGDRRCSITGKFCTVYAAVEGRE